MMDSNEGREGFHAVAQEAAVLERLGHYRDASTRWLHAAALATHTLNQAWAAHRSEFCHYAQVQLAARAKLERLEPAPAAHAHDGGRGGHGEMHYLVER